MKTKHIATIVLSMLLIYVISFGIDAQAGDGVNECPSCCFCMNDGTSENSCEVASGTGRKLCMSGFFHCGFGAVVCCGGTEPCTG